MLHRALLCFSLLFLVAVEATEKRNSCGGARCLPGIDTIAIGFDIVKGVATNLPVVEITYSKNNTWTNPFYSDLTYAVPDQAFVTTGTTEEATSYVFRNAVNYARQLTKWAGVDVDIPAAFSGSAQVNEAEQMFSETRKVLAITRQLMAIYTTTTLPTFFLKPSAPLATFIDHLPTEYDAEAYSQLVTSFGSHFITSANFGGLAVVKTVVEGAFAMEYTDSDISAQASSHFYVLKVGGSTGESKSSATKEYLENSMSSVHVDGGNFELFNVSDWGPWIRSVKQAPTQISYSLQPITGLIADPTKQANVRRAIAEHYTANNRTWKPPSTKPVVPMYKNLSWCDCVDKEATWTQTHRYSNVTRATAISLQCPPGFFVASVMMAQDESYTRAYTFSHVSYNNEWRSTSNVRCCRPCFLPVK